MVSGKGRSLLPGDKRLSPRAEGVQLHTLRASIPKGSNVVPFWLLTYFLLRDYNILPKKELLLSLWVATPWASPPYRSSYHIPLLWVSSGPTMSLSRDCYSKED